MICLLIQNRLFHNNPLNFSHRGPNQQIGNRKTPLNNNILGKVSYIGNFKDRKSENV